MSSTPTTSTLRRPGRRGVLVVVFSAIALLMAGGPAAAEAPQPSGTIKFAPASGTDADTITATTAGPCSAGTASYVAAFVTTGPGAFADPDPVSHSLPYGVALVQATPDGVSKTAPITFTFRAAFRDLAKELKLTAVPVGTYTVDLLCLDGGFNFTQTYRSTIVFTSPTTYTTAGAPARPTSANGPAPPLPAAAVTDQVASVAPRSPLGGFIPWLIGVLVLAVSGAGWLVHRRSAKRGARR